jgi:ubiquinone/menaquinone biosynthesis C-methylase UbiE
MTVETTRADAERERDHWTAEAARVGAAEAAWPEGGQMSRSESAQFYGDFIWNRIVGFLRDCDHRARVLDLGCGAGRLTLGVERHALGEGEIWGVDSSPAMLEAARGAARGKGRLWFYENDGRRLPFPDALFVAAYSMVTFQHMPADAFHGYLAEVSRVLEPGGIFVFQVVRRERGADPDGFLCHATTRKEIMRAVVDRTEFRAVYFEDDPKVSNWLWVRAVRA